MDYRNRTFLIMITAFLSFGLLMSGCSNLSSTPINKILEDPRDYSGRSVTIAGEVTEINSLLFLKYFVVKDNTGEITVITQRPLPNKGAKITVKGKVQEAFSLGDKQLIVIMENGPQ